MRFLSRKVIIVLLLAASAPVYAQRLYIAPEAGPVFSHYRVYNSHYFVGSNNQGFNVGANLGMSINKHWYLVTGLSLVNKGFTAVRQSKQLDTISSFSLTGLQVPLLIGYQFSPGGYGNIFFETGPYVSFNLIANSSRYIREHNTPNDLVGYSGVDFRYRLGSSTDWGWATAVGYKFPFGLFVKLQYNLGFNKLQIAETGAFKQGNFSVSVGYIFDLNKNNKNRYHKSRKDHP